MPNPVAAKAEDPDQLLRDACTRSAVVEFHCQEGRSAEPAARARMVGLTEDALFVDEPQIIGQDPDFKWGARYAAYFHDGDTMYTFLAIVEASKCKLKLNETKTVVGMKLARPHVIEVGQRRQFFRTSLALETPVPIRMHKTDRENPMRTPITALRCEALLLDGSGGGIGVRVDGKKAGQFKLYDHFFVSFELPTSPRPFLFLTELRQVREIRGGESVKLGLNILDWPDSRQVERNLQPFTQHLNEVQRSKLRAS